MKMTLLASLTSLVLLLPLSGGGIAQTYHLACQVAASAGGEGNFQGKNYAFTLGEAVVATFDAPGATRILTQGFHQPECADAPLVGVKNEASEMRVALFPNPASEVLWLEISPAPTGAFTVQVFDLLGQAVLPPATLQASEKMPVQVATLPPGWYFLRAERSKTQVATLPFAKVN